MGPVERGDISSVDRMGEIADREDTRRIGAQRRVHDRPDGSPRSRSMPPSRTSSWSGIQSPVSTTVSHSMLAPLHRCRGPRPQRTRRDLGRGSPPPGYGSRRAPVVASRPGTRNAAYDSDRRSVVVISAVAQPASRKVSTADQLTSSAPTTTARRPTRPCGGGRDSGVGQWCRRRRAGHPGSAAPAADARAHRSRARLRQPRRAAGPAGS